MKSLPNILCAATLLFFTTCNGATGQATAEEIKGFLKNAETGATLRDESLLIRVDGDSTNFPELKGEWLFLDYWSTSCLPCIAEMPHVIALSKRYKDKGLKVVMINLDKSERKWKRGITGFNPPEPNFRTDRSIRNQFFSINLVEMVDDKGKKSLSTLMPQYVLISPEGKIMDKEMPKPSKPIFQKTLDRYMKNESQKLKKR